MDDILWLEIIVVHFLIDVFSLSIIFLSVFESRADRQSSRINILGFFINALAIQILCF